MKQILNKVVRVIKNPNLLFNYLNSRGVFNMVPDKLFLRFFYKVRTGKKLNLDNPKSFNEKLQWLKLNNRNPKYTQLVDKYRVREYIADKIGEEYLIPLIGVYDSFEEIDIDSLPDQFVLKSTHDSGGVVICDNKDKLDIAQTHKLINKSLKRNYYYYGREWPYKDVKPRIICEEFIEQGEKAELRDYRFFCFNGTVKVIAVDLNITDKSKTRRNVYDIEWNLLEAEITYPKEKNIKIEKPNNFEEMIKLSQQLSKNIPHVRVDFYEIDNRVLFGELTFFHQSGLGIFKPEEFGVEMGSWLKLPKSTVKE